MAPHASHPSIPELPVSETRSRHRVTLPANDNAQSLTVTLDLYGAAVNSVRYRERGHRGNWLIGDLYFKNQILPRSAPIKAY